MTQSSTANAPSPASGPTRAGRTGVLLVNVGTPDSTATGDVRRYLRQFLSDPRVIDISPVGRWLLLNLFILPFRPAKSARAYASVWLPGGSPLLVHSVALARRLAETLGPDHVVEVGMRYGNPSIASALDRLLARDIDALTVVPLFPHYASSSTGTALEETFRLLGQRWNVPPVSVVPPFYDEPAFVRAFVEVARPQLQDFAPDYVLFSYHGLPERHMRKSDKTGGAHCLASADCCARIVEANRHCYRAQCFATTRSLVAGLGLAEGTYETSFQSRLGRTPWIHPYTDVVLPEIAGRGKKRLAVLCPAFVADCLETLEEIGIRARDDWRAAGGEDLLLVHSLNAEAPWVEGLAELVREYGGAGPRWRPDVKA